MRGIGRCALVLGLLLFGGTAAQAQSAGGAAKKATTKGVYTAAQATRGAKVFMEACSMCHDAQEDWTRDKFLSMWEGKSVRELFHNVRETMPEDFPASLSRQQYADVIAYILKINGLPAGETELKTDDASLGQIVFERIKK